MVFCVITLIVYYKMVHEFGIVFPKMCRKWVVDFLHVIGPHIDYRWSTGKSKTVFLSI